MLCPQVQPGLESTRLVVHAVSVLGDALPDAVITVRRDGTLVKQADADAGGRAVFEGLPVGAIIVRVDLMGFVPAYVPNLRLRQGCTTAISVPLDVANLGDPENQ